MQSRSWVAASARAIILSLLAQDEHYGYQIIRTVRRLSDDQIRWHESMLYPVLGRLERQGLVASEWRVSQGGRRRKYYRLTRKGHDALDAEKAQWIILHTTLLRLWDRND